MKRRQKSDYATLLEIFQEYQNCLRVPRKLMDRMKLAYIISKMLFSSIDFTCEKKHMNKSGFFIKFTLACTNFTKVNSQIKI